MDTLTKLAELDRFAQLIEKQTIERLEADGFAPSLHKHNVKVIPGNKYIKIDRGDSGFLMVDGNEIYGIKAYGVIHKGHYYGTLDTVNQYNWGGYSPIKII